MKNLLIAVSFCMILFNSCEKENDVTVETVHDTITYYYLTMGSAYANDIYFKLNGGITAYVPRTNWDIAFNTGSMSSTIITNGGNGVELFAYPKGDTTAWSKVDTSGIKSWKILYNSDTTWTLGAFERNMKGYPDYGWGIYNTVNHDIVGDSLFVIKLASGQYKKLWIKRKLSTLNKYSIVYANLDGSSEVSSIVDCSGYSSKNFIYYSIASDKVVDREPATADWDFVITKYVEQISTGATTFMPYIVTGVLTNTVGVSDKGVISYTGNKTAQLDLVDATLNDYSTAVFGTSILTIGSDWKTYSQTSSSYTIKDDVAYFIRKEDNSIYKIVFTKFLGSTSGALEFFVVKVK